MAKRRRGARGRRVADSEATEGIGETNSDLNPSADAAPEKPVLEGQVIQGAVPGPMIQGEGELKTGADEGLVAAPVALAAGEAASGLLLALVPEAGHPEGNAAEEADDDDDGILAAGAPIVGGEANAAGAAAADPIGHVEAGPGQAGVDEGNEGDHGDSDYVSEASDAEDSDEGEEAGEEEDVLGAAEAEVLLRECPELMAPIPQDITQEAHDKLMLLVAKKLAFVPAREYALRTGFKSAELTAGRAYTKALCDCVSEISLKVAKETDKAKRHLLDVQLLRRMVVLALTHKQGWRRPREEGVRQRREYEPSDIARAENDGGVAHIDDAAGGGAPMTQGDAAHVDRTHLVARMQELLPLVEDKEIAPSAVKTAEKFTQQGKVKSALGALSGEEISTKPMAELQASLQAQLVAEHSGKLGAVQDDEMCDAESPIDLSGMK